MSWNDGGAKSTCRQGPEPRGPALQNDTVVHGISQHVLCSLPLNPDSPTWGKSLHLSGLNFCICEMWVVLSTQKC